MPRRDIDDIEHTLFDRDEAAERARRREEAYALAHERAEQDVIRERAAKQRAAEGMAEANERARVAEYRSAGVTPPNGSRCSLALLLQLGWTIREIAQGERVLVAPPTPAKWEGHRDADSLPEKKGERS